eukprot:CAMPEP_0179136280 /NCGR_PEP_ID=MMETSP0796-20121207/64930_1 /TAXON_ID=73915 /ORGANISM="Pyrodinium bahamense, Strain pbaha01" /LENGTH=355 /DNA_ID=CAMNT_0020835349 /DNA_START=53 /DNA_END=1121 /DNA_ORIENTATION=+
MMLQAKASLRKDKLHAADAAQLRQVLAVAARNELGSDVGQLIKALIAEKNKVFGVLAMTVSDEAGVCAERSHRNTHNGNVDAVGFLVAGALALLTLCWGARQPFHFSGLGLLAGIFWGLGKMCMYYAVRSDLGLALTGAIQCGVNLLATFVAGLLTGDHLTVERSCGMALVAFGVVGVVCLRGLAALIGISWTDDGATALEPPKHEAFIGVQSAIALSVVAGLLLGSNVVFLEPVRGPVWCFAVSMAIGQFLFIAPIAGGLLAIDAAHGRARPGLKTGLPAGLAGGAMLFVALTCNALAAYHVGVAFTALRELSLIVNGLWGIMFFKEITDPRLIFVFMGSAVVSMLGAAMLTLP